MPVYSQIVSYYKVQKLLAFKIWGFGLFVSFSFYYYYLLTFCVH